MKFGNTLYVKWVCIMHRRVKEDKAIINMYTFSQLSLIFYQKARRIEFILNMHFISFLDMVFHDQFASFQKFIFYLSFNSSYGKLYSVSGPCDTHGGMDNQMNIIL